MKEEPSSEGDPYSMPYFQRREAMQRELEICQETKTPEREKDKYLATEIC